MDDIELNNGSCVSSGKNVKNVRTNEKGYNYISGFDGPVVFIFTLVTNFLSYMSELHQLQARLLVISRIHH